MQTSKQDRDGRQPFWRASRGPAAHGAAPRDQRIGCDTPPGYHAAILPLNLSALLLLVCAVLSAAPNIHPDPSFEASGVPGVARTGEKAAYLKVGAMNHWAAFGPRISVEPFARYRVTEWVKGKVSKGNFYAPYCYEWDSYIWAFSNHQLFKGSDDWVQVSLTFVTPLDGMFLHPLAYIDCEQSEVWADDIVIEKIAEPEEVIAEIEAKRALSGDELRILARWYLGKGDVAKTAELMRRASGEVRSDIACIIAQSIKDVQERRPYVVEMIASGGPTYNWGDRRLGEITQGMSVEDKLALFSEAVISLPSSPVPAQAYRRQLEASWRAGGVQTVAEAEVSVKQLAEQLQELVAKVPDNSPAKSELQLAMVAAQEAQSKLQERKAKLGNCKVSIFGRTISPETHAIVVPDEPTPQEEHAARDLRYHLELVTGQALPIVQDKDLATATPLFVGNCAGIRERIATADFDGLGLEGIHIKTAGPALILAGNKRGVLYATYTFLEDYLGCRWFTPDCATWPTEGEISIDVIDKRYIPPLEYRSTDYPRSRDADYSVRNKYNGTIHEPDEPRGGKISYRGFVHTFNGLVPPETYFAEHPEYYSEINGQRVGPEHSQLCLTNPDVLRIAIQTVRSWIQESPEATIISVSQNDWHNYCQCDKCKALAEAEGSQAGPLLHFVNAIAEDIEKDYPDKIIDTLAYQYTRKPPLHVKPRDNVAVRLCSIECCFTHPLETDPFNKTFVDDIKGWNKICDRLHIWDYVINYAHSIMPFPNLYVLKPNIQFFVNNGVTGIYEEACYYTRGSEMQELRAYVMAKLLWDPGYDTDKAIDEFCAAYWGPAGKFIREYINLVHASAQSKPDMHVRIYSPPSAGYLTPEVLARSEELFDQAEDAVSQDAVLLHRVQVARLPILYSRIALGTSGQYLEQDGALVQRPGEDVSSLAKRFEETARKEGVTRIREGGPQASLDAWLESLPKQGKALKLNTLRNGKLELAVIPSLGGRIWRMKLLEGGRDLVKLYGAENSWRPDEGGYEEYSESGYRSGGWNEAYQVTEESERSVTLVCGLKSGLRMTRIISLDPEKPLVTIKSTVTNTTNAARAAGLRVHPEYLVESTATAQVAFRKADGTWRRMDLANPADPLAEKEMWLTLKDMPGSAWAVVDNAAGLALVNRFNAEQVGRLLLNWSGAEKRVNLEIFGPERQLGAGESMTIEHSLEVAPAPAG